MEEKRLKELFLAYLNEEIDREDNAVEVIGTLILYKCTRDELINYFGFNEEDVDEAFSIKEEENSLEKD